MAGNSRGASKRVAWCCLALLGAATAGHAAELTVHVNDSDGNPVRNAAISLHRVGPHDTNSAPSRVIIDQQGKQFVPWVSVVPRGSELVFSNHDDITHHVYSFSPARRFSFRLQSGERHAPLEVGTEGVIVLGCNIHDWMVGYVRVTDAAYTATTSADGRVRFDSVPVGEWQVQMWHPGVDEDALPPRRPVALAEEGAEIDFQLAGPLHEEGPREPLVDSGYGSP